MERKMKLVEDITYLFMKHGFRSLTMDDISVKLKVSKKTLYELFGNKKLLISECFEETFKTYRRIIDNNNRNAENAVEFYFLNIDKIREISSFKEQQRNLRELYKYYKPIFKIEVPRMYEVTKDFVMETYNRGVEEGLYLDVYRDTAVSDMFCYTDISIR